jgi:hypothetical protein
MRNDQVRDEGRTELASIFIALGSFDLPEKEGDPPLRIQIDWQPEVKGKIDAILLDINRRIIEGAPFIDNQGQKQYMQHPLTSEMIYALTDTIQRELADIVMAVPHRPSTLKKILGENDE